MQSTFTRFPRLEKADLGLNNNCLQILNEVKEKSRSTAKSTQRYIPLSTESLNITITFNEDQENFLRPVINFCAYISASEHSADEKKQLSIKKALVVLLRDNIFSIAEPVSRVTNPFF